jgi:hypothetical protein
VPRQHKKTSTERVGRAERAGWALELRKAGLTFREIGQRMGVTEQRAHRIVTEELARLNAKRAESAEAVTRLEVERLDALLAAVWEKAAAGDLAAVDRVLSIMQRRARLLGIDAEKPAGPNVAIQTNINTEALTDADRAAAIAAILARVGQAGAGPDLDGADGGPRPLLEQAGADHNGRGDEAGPLADGPAPLFR